MPLWKRKCTGDASESALLKFVEASFGSVLEWRLKNKKVFEIPFNSTNKYQVSHAFCSLDPCPCYAFQISIHETDTSGKTQHLLLMKGAPEIVFSRCSTVLLKGKSVKIDAAIKSQFDDACIALASAGERLLAFADLELDQDQFPEGFQFDDFVDNNNVANFPLDGLRLIGLASMVDPPRPEVPEAISKCRAAGIRVSGWLFRGDLREYELIFAGHHGHRRSSNDGHGNRKECWNHRS